MQGYYSLEVNKRHRRDPESILSLRFMHDDNKGQGMNVLWKGILYNNSRMCLLHSFVDDTNISVTRTRMITLQIMPWFSSLVLTAISSHHPCSRSVTCRGNDKPDPTHRHTALRHSYVNFGWKWSRIPTKSSCRIFWTNPWWEKLLLDICTDIG